MNSLIKKSEVRSFKIDEATTINRYGFSTQAYDIVEIIINGTHGSVMNKVSTKTYYIIAGKGNFEINKNKYTVKSGDIITVEPLKRLSIHGQNLKALIITNPPFNPNDEDWE